MKTVAIAFCGGCDPAFDRVEYWERIRAEGEGRITWVRPDEECTTLLLICGCKKTCAKEDANPQPRVIVVSDREQDPREVVNRLIGEPANTKTGHS